MKKSPIVLLTVIIIILVVTYMLSYNVAGTSVSAYEKMSENSISILSEFAKLE